MSLNWQWNQKCGTATFYDNWTEKEFTVSLYEGNAYLIFISEWTENERNMYNLYSFWADKEHMNNCLGLSKGYKDNLMNDGHRVLTKIRLNKTHCHHIKEITTALIKAFDEITIEIFKE